MPDAPVLLLIDGLNIAYRSFYGMPELSRPDGFPTQALHGWVKTLPKLVDDVHPEAVVVFFDLGGSDSRLQLHPAYKANRPDMPQPLVQHLPYLKDLSRALGYQVIEQAGIEADDLLASVAKRESQKGYEIYIVSADKDFAQLLNPSIHQLLPPPTAQPQLGWRTFKMEHIVEKFGVQPQQIVDYLSLVGDSSDHIDGLPGVGPKTAAAWLNKWGCLRQIWENRSQIEPIRFRGVLEQSQALLERNQKLIELHTAIHVPLIQPFCLDVEALFRFFDDMSMHHTKQLFQKKYNISAHPQQVELF